MSLKLIDRLFYLTLAGAVLLGGAAAYLEDPAVTRAVFVPVMLLLGAMMTLLAHSKVKEGNIRLRHTRIYRSRNPVAFWSNVGFLYLIGAAFFAVVLWHLLIAALV